MKILFTLTCNLTDGNKYQLACFYESIVQMLNIKENKVFICINNQILYSPQSSNVGSKEIVKDYVNKFNPDLIITINNSICSHILEITDCPVVCWTVDSIEALIDQNMIKRNLDRYHLVVPAKKMIANAVNKLKIAENKILYLIPPTIINNTKVHQTQNITFIGTMFTEGIIKNIKDRLSLTSDEMGDLQNAIESYRSDKHTPFLERLSPNLVDFINNLANENEYIRANMTNLDLFAMNAISQNSRTAVLEKLSSLGMKLYGKSTWHESSNKIIREIYDPMAVYSIAHTENVYNRSKINLNISHVQANGGFPWRITDILASNGLLVSDFSIKETLREVFPHASIPLYETKQEAYDICKKYINNDNMRKDAVCLQNELIDYRFRFDYALKRIGDLIGKDIVGNNSELMTNELIENYELVKNKAHSRAGLSIIFPLIVSFWNLLPRQFRSFLKRHKFLYKVKIFMLNDIKKSAVYNVKS